MSLKTSLVGENGTLKIAREDAQAIASLVKAWEACQERVRIHRGKPLPGTYRPKPQRRRRHPEHQAGPLGSSVGACPIGNG
jgi:hypothetical protein